MTFYSLKFKLEIMNMILQIIKNIKKVSRKSKEKFSNFFSYKTSGHEWK